jgi:hypothetical protein
MGLTQDFKELSARRAQLDSKIQSLMNAQMSIPERMEAALTSADTAMIGKLLLERDAVWIAQVGLAALSVMTYIDLWRGRIEWLRYAEKSLSDPSPIAAAIGLAESSRDLMATSNGAAANIISILSNAGGQQAVNSWYFDFNQSLELCWKAWLEIRTLMLKLGLYIPEGLQ